MRSTKSFMASPNKRKACGALAPLRQRAPRGQHTDSSQSLTFQHAKGKSFSRKCCKKSSIRNLAHRTLPQLHKPIRFDTNGCLSELATVEASEVAHPRLRSRPSRCLFFPSQLIAAIGELLNRCRVARLALILIRFEHRFEHRFEDYDRQVKQKHGNFLQAKTFRESR